MTSDGRAIRGQRRTRNRPVRRLAALVLVPGALAVAIAACGGSSSDNGGKADATAACQALSRSGANLSHPTLSVGYRLTGAGNLGVAAAGEDPSTYGNLSKPMKQVQTDVNLNNTSRASADVKSALAVCKADKLPT